MVGVRPLLRFWVVASILVLVMKKKILSIFGTRPEAIKMAPVVKELSRREGVESIVCVTAQHRRMLDQVLEIFHITPDYDLDIMQENQTLAGITSNVLQKVSTVLEKEHPDVVLVHGDTTTAMASALAAFYLQIPVGHVEAGLRTDNIYSPFPEEVNRQIIDRIARYLYAPTDVSEANLERGGLNERQEIIITGNTAIDALQYTIDDNYQHPDLEWLAPNDRLILLTSHRRENLGEPMRHIFEAVNQITKDLPDVKVIYPVHLNPKVQSLAHEVLEGNTQVKLISPLDVFDFHNFMKKSYLIMSDSGGVQEEAPSLGKPVLVLRDTTERPEGIKAGTLRLVGTEKADIVRAAEQLLTDQSEYQKMAKSANPYGDGHASRRIVDSLLA